MDKETLWLTLYEGRKINHEEFDKHFYPNGAGNQTEFICEFLDEYDSVAWQLYAHITNDRVASVETFKYEEEDTGHFRPSGRELKLTAAEKKKSAEVFDACFPDQAADEIDAVLKAAADSKASFEGFVIDKLLKDSVSYVAPDGTKGKLTIKRILQALDYSHIDLGILRETTCCEAFALCFDKKPYQPLAAILSVVDPTTYENYVQLDQLYQRGKLEAALNTGDVEKCIPYQSVLFMLQDKIPGYVKNAVRANNMVLVNWLLNQTADLSYNLNEVLYDTIRYRDNIAAVDLILESGKYITDVDDRYDPHFAARWKNDLQLQLRLLKLGFKGYIDTDTLSVEEIKALIPYGLKVTDDMFERATSQNNRELLDYVIQQQVSEGKSWWLLQKYVEKKDYQAFEDGINKGYCYQNQRLFELCLEAGAKWSERLLSAGYDINAGNGSLLEIAVDNRDFEQARYLIEHGADPKLNGRWGTTTLGEISVGPEGQWLNKGPVNEELCLYLFGHGADFSKAFSRLFHTLSASTKKAFIGILKARNLINTPDAEGHLPLYYAVNNFHGPDDGTIEYFIESGAMVNAKSINDDLLFVEAYANFSQYDHIWKLLLEKGANVNENKNRRSALAWAMLFNHPIANVKCLLEAGADPNFVFYENKIRGAAETAMDVALARGDQELIDLLKLHGAKTLAELQ